MKWRNFFIIYFLLLGAIPFLASCGSGSNNPGPPEAMDSTELKVLFTPEKDTVEPGTILMKKNQEQSQGDTIAVDIDAYQTDSVFAAAFDVEFDKDVLQFEGETWGAFLKCDAKELKIDICKVKFIPGNPSRLVVGASLHGTNTTKKNGDGNIVTLKFKVVKPGKSLLTFKGNGLMDTDLKKMQVNWYNGAITKG